MWGFEESIFDHTSCKVYTFDCTGHYPAPKRISSRVTSIKLCAGKEDKGDFRTWNSLLQHVGLSDAPAYLKMDIEGFEWGILEDLVVDGSDNLLPQQIALEMHYMTQMTALSWHGRLRSAGEIALFGDMMYRAGYNIIDRRDNSACRSCTEILLSRLRPRSPDAGLSFSQLLGESHKVALADAPSLQLPSTTSTP